MKTDVITISNDGCGMEDALAQAEKVAQYKNLQSKDALHLRLLSEEMLGMMQSITGEKEGCFWIEDQDNEFRLHLQVETQMDFVKQENLLAASTSGRNEAAKGFMGRIRTFFNPLDWTNAPVPVSAETMGSTYSWSMSSYRQMVMEGMEQEQEGAKEAWDELEKSVVTKIADDVKVSIEGRKVEMVIIKKVNDNK